VQTDAPPSAFAEDYESFLGAGNTEEPDCSVGEEDPCQIMFTSGTTGKPKGALLTHKNIVWNLFNTVVGREHRPGEISLIIGPLFHTAALNNHFTVQVALGGTSILIRKFEPEAVLASIEKEKVSVISGSPAVYNLLLQYPDRNSFDTRTVTTCTSGSSILPDEIKLRLKKLFPNTSGISDLYGCTEASPTIATLRSKDSMRKKYSVGQAVPFVEVMIADDKQKPLPSGQVGELICRGPNVMKGYYQAPEATKEAIRNGWLHTGDLARMDEDGYIYIVDRIKDMIVSGGENIYPREIEEVLLRHPAVIDVAVVGVPHELWGETVKAYVVVKDGSALDEQGIVNFCKEHLASYKKPTIVELTDAIPKNPAGKPLKRLLK
jgi:acyl-CoA synthetase (AMP-forming)/AMP-acid ligase II